MTPALEVKDLSVAYGKIEALHGVSLNVAPGSIVTVIGPNGAGKTTMLMALMGLLRSSGDIMHDGTSIAALTTEERVERGIGLVPEQRALFATMTVRENLELGAYGLSRQARREAKATLRTVFALFPRLEQRAKQLAGTLSGGERQMLALGRALMGKPKVLMLDEPSLGLAPLVVRSILRTVADLRSTGVSVLLIEQNARAALQIADYGYVLETGAITLQGPAARLLADPRIVETYLGLAQR
ncbi:MAG: ABC transporter ATP-binding protein [Alphaproteobacteria bacterium]